MTDPKISFSTLPGEKAPDLDLDAGVGTVAKKEPKMKWEKETPVFNAVAKNDPHPVPVEPTRSDQKELGPVVAGSNEKEALLKELLKEKDKTMDVMKELIEVQRKLIEQLQANRN